MNSSAKRVDFSFDWNAIVMVILGFWLSASFLLDLVIVPILSSTGMMENTGFISAGYVLFGVFNRLELVCAAVVLTAFFAFRFDNRFGDRQSLHSLIMASGLFNIALIYTYLITPQITGWGLEMEAITSLHTMPTAMIWWHGFYWGLELVKFALGLTLLRWCYQRSCSIE
ncbi:MAG: hypothetical protein WBB82_04395 [Limnothrix sp.]